MRSGRFLLLLLTLATAACGGGGGAPTDPAVNTNPVPTARQIGPLSAAAGGSAFTLTVTGADFVPESVVRWNGADCATTYVSAATLNAAVTAEDIATPGTASVTVFTPAPGGGVSDTAVFTITIAQGNPVPTVTGLAPSAAEEGGAGFTLAVLGTDFVEDSVVQWNGTDRETTFVSSTTLNVAITAADIATAGRALVTVFTRAPGGGSDAASFTVASAGAPPAISGINPESVVAGSGDVQLRIDGWGFASGSLARWNGADRATTLVSFSQILVDIAAADVAMASVGAVTVSNPALGQTSDPRSVFVLPSDGTAFFSDDFNRPDSPEIGNGWTEKRPVAFSIENDQVVNIVSEHVYMDNIVYRPITEDLRDVELGMEFIRQAPGLNFTQLHARIRRDSVEQPTTLGSYIFYVEDSLPDVAAIAVNASLQDVGECIFTTFPFPSALQEGERYRLRFRVTGDDPVVLTGLVDWFDGQTWQLFVSQTITHDQRTQPDPELYCDPGFMPMPITDSGAAGFSKNTRASDVFDNFYSIDLTYTNFIPVVSNLSAASVSAGGPAFTLTVNGAYFTPGSVVRWNGANRPTIFMSSSELRVDISAGDIAVAGSAALTVFNPSPMGGVSQPLSFEIEALGGNTFFDDFRRADNPAMGNDWIEKIPNAFELAGEGAVKQAVQTDYRDNLVYRPSIEDALDVEVSAELKLLSSQPGFPLIFSRLQSTIAAQAGAFEGYLLYVDNSLTRVRLARQTDDRTTLASIDLASAMNTVDTFRLRLRTRGTNPVQLEAFVERLDESGWQIIGQVSYNDGAPASIAAGGSSGFGGNTGSGYRFDNFRRDSL